MTAPGSTVVLTKWIGMEGTVLIVQRREKELLRRFSRLFLEEAKSLECCLSVEAEARAAAKSDVSAIGRVSQGGIWQALWEFAEAIGMGLEIDLRKIPVRQETIEICEYFRLNPYQLLSGGCLLMAAMDGQDLVHRLKQEGIVSSVIGRCTAGRTRIIRNGGDISYLRKPAADEISKITG